MNRLAGSCQRSDVIGFPSRSYQVMSPSPVRNVRRRSAGCERCSDTARVTNAVSAFSSSLPVQPYQLMALSWQ